jgi:23S rRNA (guanine745-N1)-methyltransferase
LHDRGATAPLLRAIGEMAAAHAEDVVLDAGCGDGFYLGALANESGFDAHGVDISVPAIEAAARRYPPAKSPEPAKLPAGSFDEHRREWLVANADRYIPYADRSFSLVLSITARMNAAEFRRVLRDDGRLLIGIPSPEDLRELRSKTGDEGRDRVDRTVEAFAQQFTLADRRRVTTTAELDAAAVHDVLVSIYRPMRSQPAEAMRVTFSLDLLLFRPR